MKIFVKYLLIMILMMAAGAVAQEAAIENDLRLARVRYGGGGDWYNDPSALVNLAEYINKNTRIRVAPDEVKIALSDQGLSSFPILFMTGHGVIELGSPEIERLRLFLLAGGFLYVDDDYGLDKAFRRIMHKAFPNRNLQELSFSHGIYHNHFKFPNGLPKIHEHDKKPPQGFGLFDDNNRLMVFYTYETNLSDGWADPDTHGDPPQRREAALKMGCNIIVWALMH